LELAFRGVQKFPAGDEQGENMAIAKGELVGHFIDGQTQVFREEAFLHMLNREAARAIRYQDYFSVCLLRPDRPGDTWRVSEDIGRAVSEKVPEFVRATDLVGQLSSAIAVILLHTAGEDALRVADRIRANIEQVAFRERGQSAPQRLTVSVGQVSFPHDGHDHAALLSQAMAYLEQATRGGGNQVRDRGRLD
jgi:diguanylate cyclase (GGDEF)-like protein